MQSLRLLTASVRPRVPPSGSRGTSLLQLVDHAGPSTLRHASTMVESGCRPYCRASIASTRNLGLLPNSWMSLRPAAPARIPYGAIAITRRSFHATARRDALPLIPAGLAILKSTSLLTLVTAISRVLISFLPLGGIAAFRASRLNSLLQNPERVPTVSKEAEEFYLTWCQGEKPRSITSDESYKVLDLPVEPDGSVILPDGRAAHAMPDWVGKAFRRQGQGPKDFSPASVRAEPSYSGRLDRQARMQRRVRYIIPPLPDASVRIYDSFPASTRAEIDQLRQYWGFIRLFKDRMRFGRIILFFVLILPCLLLGAAYLAAVERVPLTGRWRIILLTPEEEDAVSSSLAGVNWFKSVINLLTTEEAPAPRVVEHSDWRFRWVNDTLRKLEAGIIAVDPDRPETQRNPAPTVIQPPPSIYPLRPRPRASARLHEALPGGSPDSGREHLALGPPYSLMLMHKDEANAFSYGFGGKGAGGIVVFTGLLDEIMRHNGEESPDSSAATTAGSPTPPASQGFMSGLFGGSRQNAPPRNRDPPRPTERQTLHLASVLAHEMGHLLLSHHLETLSQQHVLWPSLLGFSMDLFRAAIWPVTFFLGPAINDALANLGKAGTKELSEKYGHIGFQFKHEYEADLASLRILALANMDPEAALLHFEHSFASLREMQPPEEPQTGILSSLFAAWTAKTHPSPEERTARMRAELDEWRKTAQAEQR